MPEFAGRKGLPVFLFHKSCLFHKLRKGELRRPEKSGAKIFGMPFYQTKTKKLDDLAFFARNRFLYKTLCVSCPIGRPKILSNYSASLQSRRWQWYSSILRLMMVANACRIIENSHYFLSKRMTNNVTPSDNLKRNLSCWR